MPTVELKNKPFIKFCLSRSWYTKHCQEIQHSCYLLSTHIFHSINQTCASLANPSCLWNRKFLPPRNTSSFGGVPDWSHCAKHKNSPSVTFRNILQVTLILGHGVAHMKVTAIDTDGDYSPPNCLPLVMLLFWKLSCLQSPQDRAREIEGMQSL